MSGRIGFARSKSVVGVNRNVGSDVDRLGEAHHRWSSGGWTPERGHVEGVVGVPLREG